MQHGDYPKEIRLTREEYNELARECSRKSPSIVNFVEVLDKDKQPLSTYMGIKIKVID